MTTSTTIWLDSQPADKLERALGAYRAQPKTTYGPHNYDGGDERFGLWLHLADRRCMRKVGVGIFDLSDYSWRNAYDGGESPAEAVQAALEDDDTYSMFMAGEDE